jgi:hypothetical protein
MGEQIQIPITKAGKGVMFAVDADDINLLEPEVFAMIVKEGLKVLLNLKMSKLDAPSKLEGDALEENKAKALELAAKNLEDLKQGKLIKRGTSGRPTASGQPREVVTEAMRLAKDFVKDAIRRAGMKISLVAASQITAAAKQQLESDPSLYEKAKANLEERAKIQLPGDISALIKESPKLKAEAEAKSAAAKEKRLSAKQAGLPAKQAGKATTKKVPSRPTA